MSPSDSRDPRTQAETGGAPGEPFVSRPLAKLAGLSASLPSLPASAPPQKQAADPKTPLGKALASRIVIARDSRGRGGKTVTWARGIAGTPALLEALARELRHELGTGVRVEDGALVAQGALTERLAASLAKRGAARIVIGN